MPLYSEDTDRRSFIPLSDVPSTFEEVIGAQFDSTLTELPGLSIGRMASLALAGIQGQKLGRDEAAARIDQAGLTGHLTADDQMTEASLDILIDRKREEMKRAEILSRADGGFAQGSARLGVALATSLLDPLNVGLAFVPVVGEARYAKLLAGAGGAFGRAGVRAGVGALEGAAGAALAEPLIYSAKMQEQADYDMADSLMNVAFGTLFGGGLHVAGGASADLIRAIRKEPPGLDFQRTLDTAAVERAKPITREVVEADGKTLADRADNALELSAARADGEAARLSAEVSPDIRQHALRVAEGQAMSGRPVNVDPLFAGERGVLPDGTDTSLLKPTEFNTDVVAPRKAEISATLDQRIADLEARAIAAGDGTKPRYTLKALRELEKLKAYREAIETVDSGVPVRPAGQAELIRQAAVTDAVDRGVAVPQSSLDGVPDSVVSKAAEIKRAAVHSEAQRQASKPDPEAIRQEAESRVVDEEITKADEALEAAEEEAAFAEQMVQAQAKRYDLEPQDAAMTAAAELTKNAERWSRIAEAATSCLMRGI